MGFKSPLDKVSSCTHLAGDKNRVSAAPPRGRFIGKAGPGGDRQGPAARPRPHHAVPQEVTARRPGPSAQGSDPCHEGRLSPWPQQWSEKTTAQFLPPRISADCPAHCLHQTLAVLCPRSPGWHQPSPEHCPRPSQWHLDISFQRSLLRGLALRAQAATAQVGTARFRGYKADVHLCT